MNRPDYGVVDVFVGAGDARWVGSVASLMPPGPARVTAEPWTNERLIEWATSHGGPGSRGVVLCLTPSQPLQSLGVPLDPLTGFDSLYVIAPDNDATVADVQQLRDLAPDRYACHRRWRDERGDLLRLGLHQRCPTDGDFDELDHPPSVDGATPSSATGQQAT